VINGRMVKAQLKNGEKPRGEKIVCFVSFGAHSGEEKKGRELRSFEEKWCGESREESEDS